MKKELFLTSKLPEGAVEIHLYMLSNVLRPRGHMKKESIGVTILERLEGAYESWTDPKMGDCPDESALIEILKQNLQQEVDGAWKIFLERINSA